MYRTLIIGEHRRDEFGRIELLGPDSLAVFIPISPGDTAGTVLCEDGILLKVSLPVTSPPPGFVCSYQVTAAHCMVKTYLPQIGDRALLMQEATKRGLAILEPGRSKSEPKTGCRCDIRNLMSTGHDAGCSERR